MDAASLPAAQIRYIKLGAGGLWAKRAFLQSELHLEHKEVPRELALTRNKTAIAEYLVTTGRSPGKANDFAREIVDSYASPRPRSGSHWRKVAFGGFRPKPKSFGLVRARGMVRVYVRHFYPWQNTDLKGRPLATESLSTKPTKVAAYRQTLCSIAAGQYLRSNCRAKSPRSSRKPWKLSEWRL